jgi:hypothetical protein
VEAISRGVAAAAVPALLSATITRVFMRLVALLVNTETHFDPLALVGIFVIYSLLLLPGCLALALNGSRWPWLLFGAGWAVLLSAGVAIGLDETSATQEMSPLHWLGLSLVLLVMAATYTGQGISSAHWARHGVPCAAVVPRPPRAPLAGPSRRTLQRDAETDAGAGVRCVWGAPRTWARQSGAPRAAHRRSLTARHAGVDQGHRQIMTRSGMRHSTVAGTRVLPPRVRPVVEHPDATGPGP